MSFLTLEESRVEVFPFKKGDRVRIDWNVPVRCTDFGIIDKLFIGRQYGYDVVYATMVLIDGIEKAQSICPTLLTKLLL